MNNLHLNNCNSTMFYNQIVQLFSINYQLRSVLIKSVNKWFNYTNQMMNKLWPYNYYFMFIENWKLLYIPRSVLYYKSITWSKRVIFFIPFKTFNYEITLFFKTPVNLSSCLYTNCATWCYAYFILSSFHASLDCLW